MPRGRSVLILGPGPAVDVDGLDGVPDVGGPHVTVKVPEDADEPVESTVVQGGAVVIVDEVVPPEVVVVVDELVGELVAEEVGGTVVVTAAVVRVESVDVGSTICEGGSVTRSTARIAPSSRLFSFLDWRLRPADLCEN
jgi:hypothetical protein